MSLTAPIPTPESQFHDLLRDARNGSQEARWMVIHLFRKVLLAIANEQVDRDIKLREAASDIVQETIVEAQRDFTQFQGQSEREMGAWLKTVLIHNIHNISRKHRAGKCDVQRNRPLDVRGEGGFGVSIPDPGPLPIDEISRREAAEALERALRELPTPYRKVIHLRTRRGLPYNEIACKMNRTEEATRKLWSRALHVLSRRMRKHQALHDEGDD